MELCDESPLKEGDGASSATLLQVTRATNISTADFLQNTEQLLNQTTVSLAKLDAKFILTQLDEFRKGCVNEEDVFVL